MIVTFADRFVSLYSVLITCYSAALILPLSLVTLHYLQIKAQLLMSSSDYDSLQQRCSECHATLKLLKQLVQLVDGFDSIQKLIASKSYKEATVIRAQLRNVLTDISEVHGNDIVVLPCLDHKLTVVEDELEMCVLHRWKEMITWTSSPVVLTIVSGPDAHHELHQLAQSLHNLGSLSAVITKFARQVMTQIVNKVLVDSNNLEINRDTSSVSVKVIATVAPGMDGRVERTLQKLQLFCAMIETLYEHLLNINITDEISPELKAVKDTLLLANGVGNLVPAAGGKKDALVSSVRSSHSLMSMFGEECNVACLEGIVNHCLSSAVPAHRSELVQFSQVPAAVEDLQRKLMMFGFINDDNQMMMDYVKNIDVLFANKRCVELLDEARKLLMSNIHNIVQVECHLYLITMV